MAFVWIGLGFFAGPVFADTQVGSTHVFLSVPGCNNNGICEPSSGEDSLICPLDCSSVVNPVNGGRSFPSDIEPSFATSTITDLRVVVSTTTPTVDIYWTTPINNSLLTRYWGLTPEYSGGSLSEVFFAKYHHVTLQNLEPNTLYFFKIQGRDIVNNDVSLKGITFHTYSQFHGYIPPNISDFRARVVKGAVDLSWYNSSPQNLVRILRSEYFYPRNPFEGRVVYEGARDFVHDADVTEGKIYYYTAFAESDDKVFSSGAITSVYIPFSKPEFSLDENVQHSKPLTDNTIPTSSIATLPNVSNVSFDFLRFVQYDKLISSFPSVKIQSESPTTVLLSKNVIPPNIENVIMSISPVEKPSENRLFFLFFDKARGEYQSTLGPLKPGEYSMSVVGLNDAHNPLFRIIGKFKVVENEVLPKYGSVQKYIVDNWAFLLVLIIVIILISVVVFGTRNKKRRRV